MKISIALVGLVLVNNLYAKTSYESSTLCVLQDEVYFSCKTKESKTISLCGNSEKGLYYRFGKPKKIELEYPGNNVKKEESLSLFFYNSYHRWMVSYFTVTFHSRDYTYLIQDLRNDEEGVKQITQNIVVYTDPDQMNKKAVISCASNVISNLWPLVNIIPCNKEMALGCSQDDGYLDLGTNPK